MTADADKICTLPQVTDTLSSVADDSSANPIAKINPIVAAGNNENLQIWVGKASIG